MINKVILIHRVKSCYIENVSGERGVHKKNYEKTPQKTKTNKQTQTQKAITKKTQQKIIKFTHTKQNKSKKKKNRSNE